MAKYHLYFFDGNELIGGERIDAADDDAAVLMARERGKGQAVEVWNAHSRVRVVAPAKGRQDA
jgi:hypothetical protein